MSKLELTDNAQDTIIKMSEGNPGALRVCMELFEKGFNIDPYGMGGFGTILMLDTYEIYGSDIYVIWKDICGQNLRDFVLLIRACQMGYFSILKVKDKIKQGYSTFSKEEWEEMNNKVCERLPNFQKKDNNE